MPPEGQQPASFKIRWNEVTWYSKLGAIILFVGVVPALSFYIGIKYQESIDAFAPIEKNFQQENIQPRNPSQESFVASTTEWKSYKSVAWNMSMQLPPNAIVKEIDCNGILCQINISGDDYRVILRKIDATDTEFATSTATCGNSNSYNLYFNFDNYKSKSSEIGKQMLSTLSCS
jgi:hypothetical protein